MSSYVIFLNVHSLLRWLVILSCAWALLRVWSGFISKSQWTDKDRKSGLIFTSILNVQFLIGLVLYFISPITKSALADFGAAMKNGMLRFFTVEHVTGMLLAVIIAQAGYSISKRAATDRSKFLKAAIFYTIALVLILASIPWPFMKYGRPLFPSFG